MVTILESAPETKSPQAERIVQNLDPRRVDDAYTIYRCPEAYTKQITIIRPAAVLSRTTHSAPVTPPIGPAYLAAVLRKSGYSVQMIDAIGEEIHKFERSECGHYNLQGLSTDEIIDKITPDAEIIGVSIMFSLEWLAQRTFLKALRARFPNAKIIVGGEHVTALPEFVLRDCPEVDYAVLGEGELTFLDLIHALTSKTREIGEIGGVAFIDEEGNYRSTLLSKRIAEISELPRPAWDLLPIENYMLGNWTMGISMGRNMPILATRGCPYQCTFCSSPSMWTTRYLMRSPSELVDEIEWLTRDYGANSIDFFDLTAIVKKEWILEFCGELKRRGLNLTWQLPSGTRSEALDADTLQAIKQQGLRYLVYAPESGSEKTLELIKKKVKLPRLVESIKTAVKIGHVVKVNLIIGFPEERLISCLSTIWFAIRMGWYGADDTNIAIFAPYPGSEIYRNLVKEGRLQNPDDTYFSNLIAQFDMTSTVSYCKNVPGWFLAVLRVFGHAAFYTIAYLKYPNRLVRVWKNSRNGHFQACNLFEQRIYDAIARSRLSKRDTAEMSCSQSVK
jgi:radical SAM superfamily enzyme YgiQ (UPF0313 family)